MQSPPPNDEDFEFGQSGDEDGFRVPGRDAGKPKPKPTLKLPATNVWKNGDAGGMFELSKRTETTKSLESRPPSLQA